jgi:hypothetical protein
MLLLPIPQEHIATQATDEAFQDEVINDAKGDRIFKEEILFPIQWQRWMAADSEATQLVEGLKERVRAGRDNAPVPESDSAEAPSP